jgi:PhnB protein
MSFSPYLAFPGTCREAMTAYARIFGAKDLEVMTYADAPPDAGPGRAPSDRVMHSQLSAGPGAPLFGMDLPEGIPDPGPGGRFFVFHGAPDAARARAIFDALGEGGQVVMPFEGTFWSEGFGMVTDRWGTSWMISVQPSQAASAMGDLAAGAT